MVRHCTLRKHFSDWTAYAANRCLGGQSLSSGGVKAGHGTHEVQKSRPCGCMCAVHPAFMWLESPGEARCVMLIMVMCL